MADQPTHNAATSMSSASTTRRTLLKGFAAAGAAISMSSKVAWADGEIGYWAKDLPNEKLVDMYSTILRIRWFERTLADKQLSDRSFRNLIHLYAGQEAVATGVCAALNNNCLLYTSDAADEEDSVDLGGRRIIKKQIHK